MNQDKHCVIYSKHKVGQTRYRKVVVVHIALFNSICTRRFFIQAKTKTVEVAA